ncbi:probable protein phosphatase 2C 24 [Humulus lupulus]|uniref:probable protein phosphatase 2C 24 n=1 Tax=Humulus lupulus TaxID=3486 RepID=UPI002B40AD45|nr:probable protein phosphatase 2C 24 [Humulus lupulus]
MMAGICCGVVGEGETSSAIETSSSRTLKRRKMELLTYKFITDVTVPSPPPAEAAVEPCSMKRQKLELRPSISSSPRECVKGSVVESCEAKSSKDANSDGLRLKNCDVLCDNSISVQVDGKEEFQVENPKYGVTSVCGRRRDMEDAVSAHPYFSNHLEVSVGNGCHFYGVFDGHGCSHVAMKCKERLHEIVKEELEGDKSTSPLWKEMMERSFTRMDEEVQAWNESDKISNCRCELQTPRCDAVGSTAVVSVVTSEKIVVSNCGDSRAVLCRNGVAIPLSSDHKPDRPDELVRIENAGGRVIYWDGARVLGMLAMSRAIGDNYLKPYVIPEPEVTITDRMADDECLILASDGLWDVVSNETACCVARMCLRAQKPPPSPSRSPGGKDEAARVVADSSAESSDKACSDASILLTKLALARHSTDNVSVVVVDLRRERQR